MKECEWCGGLFDKGYTPVGRRKLYPQYFCSYECSEAIDYYKTLFIGAIFAFGSIFLLIGSILFPVIASMFQGFPMVVFLFMFGQILGWGMLVCSKGSREYRRSIPRDSRKGQLVEELLEYHDY